MPQRQSGPVPALERRNKASLVLSAAIGLVLSVCPVASSGDSGPPRHVALLVSADVRPSCQAEVDGLRIRLTCGQDALDTARVVVAGLVPLPELFASRTDQTRTFAFAKVDATMAALSFERLSTEQATDDILVTIVF